MNVFKILNKTGEALTIAELDAEVCKIVGVEIHPKYYCKLGKREEYKSNWDYVCHAQSWYDSIGWMIASDGKTFEGIIEYYTDLMKEFIGQLDDDGVTIITIDVIYPYHMKVLRSWIEKGYQPISIPD